MSVNIWQEAFTNWHKDVYQNTPSVNKEPEKHVGHGMTRVCEFELIVEIARDCGLYVELGCGDGFSLLLMKKLGVMCFGFDHVPNVLDGVGTSYIKCEIFDGLEFTAGFKMQFSKLITDEHGVANCFDKVFVYCDNGSKVEELNYVAPLLKSGDILGTHDCPTEVPDDFCPEGYERITDHDDYIKHYACLQRFWRKV